MTNEVQTEETPNPYNKNKSWHEGDIKPFESSEGLYFEKPEDKNKLFKSNDINEAVNPENVETEELESKKDTPYKKPDYKKRYDDLKKHYDNKLNEFRLREEELKNQVQQPEYTAPKTEEELEKFKTDYPDVYEVVETVAHMQSESKAKVLEERLSKLQQREQELIRKDAEKRLMDRHPDFEDIRNSDDFHSWAKEQPEQIQDWIYDNPDNANLAIKAIDLYKLEKGIKTSSSKRTSSKSQSTGSAADMVSTKTTSVNTKEPKIWTRKEINSLSMDDYDKYEQEIDLAVMEGRVR